MENPNKPIMTVRDKELKMSVFENQSEHGTFYTITPAKTYEKDGNLYDTHSFKPHDLLRLAEMARQTYCNIAQYRMHDTIE